MEHISHSLYGVMQTISKPAYVYMEIQEPVKTLDSVITEREKQYILEIFYVSSEIVGNFDGKVYIAFHDGTN
jgi:hypothetical protein